WKNSPSRLTNHSCNRSKPSPPGLLGSSFGPAMYPSRDIDIKSIDADIATSCGLDPDCLHRSVRWRRWCRMQDVDGAAQGEVEADIAEETTFDPDGYRAELAAPEDAVGTRLLLANERLRVWEI